MSPNDRLLVDPFGETWTHSNESPEHWRVIKTLSSQAPANSPKPSLEFHYDLPLCSTWKARQWHLQVNVMSWYMGTEKRNWYQPFLGQLHRVLQRTVWLMKQPKFPNSRQCQSNSNHCIGSESVQRMSVSVWERHTRLLGLGWFAAEALLRSLNWKEFISISADYFEWPFPLCCGNVWRLYDASLLVNAIKCEPIDQKNKQIFWFSFIVAHIKPQNASFFPALYHVCQQWWFVVLIWVTSGGLAIWSTGSFLGGPLYNVGR